jgi:hypothetical protein
MDKIPKIEKTVKEFVRDESGAVTKDGILKAGMILGAASFALAGTAAATTHVNTLTVDWDGQTGTGTHSHHGQHTSY